ncbi:MAG: tetratricopeptide repeat protein [Deltaproteobacteria bacterium]|nr:tetratricopeptide repeat protein [Deltaproteobacteria bacterium]
MIRMIAVGLALSLLILCRAVGSAGAKDLIDYYKEGMRANNGARYHDALEIWKKALNLAQEQGREKLEGNFFIMIGLTYCDLNQHKKALRYYKQALVKFKKTKDMEGVGNTLVNIGSVYDKLDQYERSLGYYKQALTIYDRIGDLNGKRNVLIDIGIMYGNLSLYERALNYFRQALAISKEAEDAVNEANTLGNIGAVYANIGLYKKALDYYEDALTIYRRIENIKLEGTSLGNIGLVYSNLSDYEKALDYHHQALAIARKIGDCWAEAGCLINIGLVYIDFAHYQKALEYCLHALAIDTKIENLKGKGRDLANIGLVYQILGRYEKALRYFKRALANRRKIGYLKGEGEDLLNIGVVYARLGQYEKALWYFRQALAFAREIGDLRGEANSLSNIGLVFRHFGEYEKAIKNYKMASAINMKIGDERCQGANLDNIGCAMLASGESFQAESHLKSTVELWESIRGKIKSAQERTGFQSTLPNVYGTLAAARLAQGKLEGAFESIERGRSKSFMDLLGTRAAATRRSNNKTVQLAETKGQLAVLREKSIELGSTPVGAKTRAVRTALNQEISELDKKRLELIEQLRRSDPELGSLVVVDPPKLKEIQALLPPGTTLVEYFHPGKHTVAGKDQDQLWIFVLHSGGLHFKAVDVSKSTLEKALEEYAKLVADGSSEPEAVASAGAKLHKWLIDPIEPIAQLTNADTLIIVPWGPMFKIPFAALRPKGGNPLGAKKNIVMAPSAGVYRYLVKKRASGRKNILAIGNPKTAMTPLPGAEKEAREIALLFGKSAIYTRSKATEGLIKKDYPELGRPDVIHLACHGIFNEKAPQLSHLALTPDQKNDGNLEMHELFDLDWRGVSLVTMSACSSGKGKLGAGDDLVGLTRGFMFAGAPSILCSLWDVDDEATRTLMVSFYKNYLGGMSKPEALRKAQMSMMNNKKWSHPYYWSAFVLFGDWE